jgi:hypothetical protein
MKFKKLVSSATLLALLATTNMGLAMARGDSNGHGESRDNGRDKGGEHGFDVTELDLGDYEDFDSYLFRLSWGNFDSDNRDNLEDSDTDWSGTISFDGAVAAYVKKDGSFDKNEDSYEEDESYQIVDFTSIIHGAYDGLYFGVQVASDVVSDSSSADYPTVSFDSDYLDEVLTVSFEDLISADEATITEEGDYQVFMQMVTRDEAAEWVDENVNADDFVELIEDLMDVELLDSDNEALFDEIVATVEESLEEDDNFTGYKRLFTSKCLKGKVSDLEELVEAYEEGEIDEEELNEGVAEVLESIMQKIENQADPSDVVHDSWYADSLDEMIEAGIIGCYEDATGDLTGECGPGDDVTYQEVLAISYRIAYEVESGYGANECSDSAATDTAASDTYGTDYWVVEAELACILEAGGAPTLLAAVAEDNSLWNEKVPRYLAVLTLFEVVVGDDLDNYVSEIEADADSFKDVDGLSDAVKAVISAAKDAGIIDGEGGDGTSFNPHGKFNRAAMFKVAALLYEVYEGGGSL